MPHFGVARGCPAALRDTTQRGRRLAPLAYRWVSDLLVAQDIPSPPLRSFTCPEGLAVCGDYFQNDVLLLVLFAFLEENGTV